MASEAGHRRGDRQRHRGRDARGGGVGSRRRHPLRAAGDQGVEPSSSGSLREAHPRPPHDRRRAPRGSCARAAPACCRSGSPRSRAASRPATRSTSSCDGEVVGKGIVNYSSAEIARIKGCARAPSARADAARRRGGGAPRSLRARVSAGYPYRDDGHRHARTVQRHLHRLPARRLARSLAVAPTAGSRTPVLDRGIGPRAACTTARERHPRGQRGRPRRRPRPRPRRRPARSPDAHARADRGDGRRRARDRRAARPVGEEIEHRTLASGLDMRKVRVPLGVVAVVYEARPNVTIDCAALTIKSGNAIVLRGSSYAERSNGALAAVVREALAEHDLPEDCVSLLGGRRPRRARRARHPGRADRPPDPARRRGAEGRAEGASRRCR